ncbi:hypothetical protein RDABS01_026647 [Bienertia sinuspersici]
MDTMLKALATSSSWPKMKKNIDIPHSPFIIRVEERIISFGPATQEKQYVGDKPKHEAPITKTQVAPKGSSFVKGLFDKNMEKLKMSGSKYDRTTDLEDHVSAYEGHMMLYKTTNSVWYKVFLVTLTGIAQSWQHKTLGELIASRKREVESLRDYIARFNAKAILTLMSGLRDGPVRQYLGKKSFLTLAKVLGKANDFIRGRDEFIKATDKNFSGAAMKQEPKAGGKGRNDTYKKRKYTLKLPEKKEADSFEGRRRSLTGILS